MIFNNSYNFPLIVIVTMILFSGCAGPLTDSDTREQTREEISPETETILTDKMSKKPSTPTEVQMTTPVEPTDRVISSTTSTKTPPQTNPTNWSQKRKYEHFKQDYIGLINDNVPIYRTSIYPDNESMSISYVVNEAENSTENQTLYTIIGYANMVDMYNTRINSSHFDEEWVPKHINVTAVNQNGEVYYSGYLKYKWAYKWKVGNGWNDSKVDDGAAYTLKFYNTTEIGPAHPKYR